MPVYPRMIILVSVALTLILFISACGTPTSTTTISTAAPAATSASVASGATAQSEPATPAPIAEPTTIPAAPTAATAQVANVGDRAEQGGVALTVTKVERKDKPSQFAVAKAGNTFLVAEVVIENASSDSKVSYNPFFFKLKDADGFEYTPAFGADQALSNGELAKGEKARGNVMFEVKKVAKGLVLSYQANPFDSNSVIKISIPDA